ncbi:hypothetical protein [Sporocytophaga sp.]|nr:hypothetical protein [Sporocytophaga sp.]
MIDRTNVVVIGEQFIMKRKLNRLLTGFLTAGKRNVNGVLR